MHGRRDKISNTMRNNQNRSLCNGVIVFFICHQTQNICITFVRRKHLYNNCTMLVQRRRRWDDVVQMLYKCFVLAGIIVQLF